jgi:uncharacterized protein (DUF433 family)
MTEAYVATRNRTFSIRIRPQTLERLEERAELSREGKTRLAQRYVEEGVRMEDHPRIRFVQGRVGRRPAIVGTRLAVSDVIETVRANENSLSEAAEYLDIPERLVRAAWDYYMDYQDEIDEWIERKQRLAEREEERWRRTKAALA